MEPISSILVAPAAERTTAPSGFGASLRAVAVGAADGLAAAAGIAPPLAPVGMVLAGAIRGIAGGAATRGSVAVPETLPGSSVPAAPGTAPGGDAFEAARLLQLESQSFNLRYLELQEGLQRESRQFTALSNAMKVRHDTARSAIHNIQ
jgi:hypothetical protein